MQVSPSQVYQQVLADGGTQLQGQVAAALVSGIESDGDPTELAGGRGPAAGLFQYEPGTWLGQGGGQYASVAQDASWQDQVKVFVHGTAGNNFGAWGPDLAPIRGDPNSASNSAYGYSGAPAPGSPVYNFIQANAASLGGPDLSSLAGDPSGYASLAAARAANPGVDAYFNALTGNTNAPASTGLGAAQAAGAPGDTSTQGDAESQIVAGLTPYGLQGLAGWVWNELTSGKNQDQVGIDVQQTPEWLARFPGMAERQAKGLPAITPTQYLAYEDAVYNAAQAAGLPQNFVDRTTIGNLIGNDVSSTEAQQRITSGYQAAMNAPVETRNLLHQYFGVDTGQLAAYYLDPTKAEGLLKNQLVAAEVGTQAAQSGFGTLTSANATGLASELAAQGKVNPSGSGTWDVDIGTQLGTLAPLAKLQQAMPGMGAAAPAVTQKELLDYGFLSKGQQNVQAAVETRKAFAGGGGGEDVTGAGVVGVGNASAQGNKQQSQSGG